MNKTFLIVGLGNPTDEYTNTRHNIGFIFADYLKDNWRFENFKLEKNLESEISIGRIGENKVILSKPSTYMNLSGSAVSKIAHYYQIDTSQVIIAFDDLDIELGKFKSQLDKSPRQHNGVNSIMDHLSTTQFHKIRIGIENRGDLRKLISGKDFVLSKFKVQELDSLREELFPQIQESVEKIIGS